MVGIAEVVEADQCLLADAIATGNRAQTVAAHHRVASTACGDGWTWKPQLLANLHMVGIPQAVEPHQRAYRDAVAISDI